jgi:hypothetical protein
MKSDVIERVRLLLVAAGVEVLDIRSEASQGGFYVTLPAGAGARFAKGTWLIDYGSRQEACAVLYINKQNVPIGHGYTGKGWAERFVADFVRVYDAQRRCAA